MQNDSVSYILFYESSRTANNIQCTKLLQKAKKTTYYTVLGVYIIRVFDSTKYKSFLYVRI